MKNMKKIFCMIMTIAFVLTFACPVSAEDADTETLTEGEWMNVHSSDAYYRVVVDCEGYITLTSKTESEDNVPYYEILNSKKKPFSVFSSVDGGIYDTETIDVAVSKGTYYIHYFGYDDDETACVKYNFTPIKQKKNYCKAKALTLKAGTKSTIYQTPRRGFNRYFKIKLASKKRITVYSESYIDLFDSDMKYIETSTSFADDSDLIKARTPKKLPKGTYYIVVAVHDPFTSSIDTIKWQ